MIAEIQIQIWRVSEKNEERIKNGVLCKERTFFVLVLFITTVHFDL